MREERQPSARVGLFVDWASLLPGLELVPPTDQRRLLRGLRPLAERHGRLLLARAYGDWTRAGEHARELGEQQIEPRLVLGESGPAAALELGLDVTHSLLAGPELDVYLLVSDDGVHRELLRRLRQADRRLVVAGLERSQSASLRAAADQALSLERELGLDSVVASAARASS